jgi:hypothetical protein
VVFSEPVEQTSAESAGNYQIDNGIAVSAASLNADEVTVTLTTSIMDAGASYVLTVNNVADQATTPNPIAPDSTAGFTFVPLLVLQQSLNGYTGVADTWFEYTSESSYFNRGAQEYLRFWNPIELGGARKIVIRFDLSDLDSRLPVGAAITGATLGLYHFEAEAPKSTYDDSVELCRMLRTWVEGTGTGHYNDPITGASYYYWNSATRNPTGWVQNATYSNVWELDVTGLTIDHCQQDRGWGASSWIAVTSIAEVAAGTWRWHQDSGTLYVNKDNSTTQDPTKSSYGFSYLLDTDKWDGVSGTGAADVDLSSKLVFSWPNYDKDYDPGNPGELQGYPDWVCADITGWVLDWQANPSTNCGFMVAENDVGGTNPEFKRTQGRQFRSSEYDAGGGDYSYGPKLTIEYEIILPGDLDDDGDVDLDDYELFETDLTGPAIPSASPADLDSDGDVDLGDFSMFAAHLTGP